MIQWKSLSGLVLVGVVVMACSGSSSGEGSGSQSDPSSEPPSCEALCKHIEAVACDKNNAAPHADCLARCSDLQAKPACKTQSDALIGCCQKKDLSSHCSDNVLDPRDCDDDDVCKSEGDALRACSG